MIRHAASAIGCLSLVLILTCRADAQSIAGTTREAALADAVNKLFEVGWTTSYKGRGASDTQFGIIQQIAPDHPQAVYAFALINAKQRRYDEASELLAELIQSGAGDAHVWQAKIWLSVFTRNLTRSLVEMEQFAQRLGTDPTPDAMEAARFLGVMYGYLEGPVESSIDDTIVANHKARLMATLSSVLASVFQEANQAVLQRHAELLAELEVLSADALTTAEANREKQLEQLDQEERDIATSRSSLDPRRDKLTADMREELAEIRKEDQPFADRITELESQALVIRRDSFWVTSEMSRMHAQSLGSRDPTIRDAFLRELNRLSFLSNQYQASLSALERRAASINQQRREIQQRYQRTEASYKKRLEELDEEQIKLDRQEKRLSGTRKRAEKPARADVRKTRVLSDRAKSLSTYHEFPWELEKLRIQNSFR